MNSVTINLTDFTPKFRGDGYVMSYVTQTVLRSRLIRLKCTDGRVGYGEIISDPGLNIDEIFVLENSILQGLEKISLQSIPNLIRKLRLQDPKLTGLACGLEMSYFDLLARSSDIPLFALLGGRLCDDIPDYLSLSCGEPETMAGRIKSDGLNRDVVQVKLSGSDIKKDINRLDAVLEVLKQKQTLLVDFNGALDPARAREFISGYSDKRIMWEELCLSYEENRDLVETTGARLLFDQCLKPLSLITRACADGVMAGACIKADSLGGLGIARTARDVCSDSGVAIRVDGLWCGPVATAASLQLAVGTPPDLLIAGCNLCEPLVLDEDWGGILYPHVGRIAPTNNPGHGVTPPAGLMETS